MRPRQHRRLDPVADLQLFQNRRHVMFDGLFLQLQRLANLAVAFAQGDQLQDLFLTLGQIVQRGRLGGGVFAAPHRDQQPTRQSRRDIGPTRRQIAHQINQFAGTHAFQDIAHRAQLDRLHQIVIRFRGGEHCHAGRRVQRHDPRQGTNSAALGHRNVQQHHVGPFARHHLDRLLAVTRLAHNLQIAGIGHAAGQPVTVDRMVVSQNNPDFHSTSLTSIVITSSLPETPSLRFRSTSRPPRLSTRPANPARPRP